MRLAVAPLSVIVDGTKWFAYSSGIFNGCTKNLDFNHAGVLVGVDLDGNWKVRNSWGGGWGEQGYIRIPRNNDCGIVDWALTPNFV